MGENQYKNKDSKNKSSSRLISIIILILIIVIAIFFMAVYLERKALEPKRETGAALETRIYFCPKDNCEQIFVDEVNKANKVECALYDLDSQMLISALKKKNARLLLETDNIKEARAAGLIFTADKNSYLMHNKFCILDDKKVITGSTNPTNNDFHKNNNNLLIVYSETLSKNYQNELNALMLSSYNKERTQDTRIEINGRLYQNYFCPQDSCREHVASELKKAEKSIYFMTFSFTDDALGDMLVEKHKGGLNVSGIFDKSQIDEWSEYRKLKANGVEVIMDTNKYKLHHKVFIIDSRVIVTGSYNPTKGGDEKNNENIIIIEDENIAAKYLSEFSSLLV